MKRWILIGVIVACLALSGCDGRPASATPAEDGRVSASAEAHPQPGAGAESAPRGRTAVLPPAALQRRYALVFGNGAYGHGDALAGPARDAALIANALQARGYQVLLAIDRDLRGMREDVAAFEEMSSGADLRVLYFAGHGFEFEHANYLMPVDLPASIGKLDRQAVRNNAMRLDELVWTLEQGAPALIAIIDACRVSPARGPQSALALGQMAPARGTILAYATEPGRVAMDSLRAYGVDADHAPYSYFLASALRSPEVASWDQAFLSAASIVIEQTRGAQRPWMNAQVDRFPLVGKPSAPTAGQSSTATLLGLEIQPERRAAARYWARRALAAEALARDGNRSDATLAAMADRGDTDAALALATRATQRGDTGEALRRLEALANAGHAVARNDLGTLLYALKATDREGHPASYWWHLASAQGIGEARAKLALSAKGDTAMLEFIRGVMETHQAFMPEDAGDRP